MPPPAGMDNEARHKLASPISGELCKVGLPARPPSPHFPGSKRGNGEGGVSSLLETPQVSKGLAVLLGGRVASLEGYRRRLEQVTQSHWNALLAAVLLDPVKGEPHRKNLGIPGFPAFWTVSLHGLRRPFAFPFPEESTMPLPPETFQLESPEPRPTGRSGFRVPFGLRDGRAWAPAEVAKGKACGCVCPGCHAPLSAKAQNSRRKRPHFAHLVDMGCTTGRETGIHLRAKQLIAERGRLLLPTWMGSPQMTPNPPLEQDIAGYWHRGRDVDVPERWGILNEVRLEHRMGAFTPDVLAVEDEETLLIEVRVTHAVDEPKLEWARSAGYRMLEIDLSRLDRNTPHDIEAFEATVLADVHNRCWIAHPEAEDAWRASKAELIHHVAARNAWISDQRQKVELEEQQWREEQSRDAKARAGRRESFRTHVRAKHANDLKILMGLTDPERISRLLQEYRRVSGDRVRMLSGDVPDAVRVLAQRWHKDAWVFGTHPEVWQLQAYVHFVGRQSVGYRFNQRDVSSWVRRSFPIEAHLYRLFVAKYAARAEARRAGFAKRSLDYWVFSPEENRRIPDFYAPINDFIGRLIAARFLRALHAPIGECEVAL